jgi:hypothetical protein
MRENGMRSSEPDVGERMRMALLSWPFLLALAVLLVNDHYLKAAHPGFVSGNLSDVAAIFGVGLIAFAASRDRPWLITAILVGSFLRWKSAASQSPIDALMMLGYPRIMWIDDYTDLGAFIVLPLAWRTAAQLGHFQVIDARFRPLVMPPVLATAVLAVAAPYLSPMTTWTSQWVIRPSASAPLFRRSEVEQAIHTVAEKYDLKTKDWKPDADKVRYERRLIVLEYAFGADGAVVFTLTGVPDMAFFFQDDNEKTMTELRADIRREFRWRFGDIEYSESPTTNRTTY